MSFSLITTLPVKIRVFTCEDDKSVLSVHMFVDRSIIPIDSPEEIVLSHEVRIHLCCWSLTADNDCLGWLGQGIQVKVWTELCQDGEFQEYQGHTGYNRCPIFVVKSLNLFFAFG